MVEKLFIVLINAQYEDTGAEWLINLIEYHDTLVSEEDENAEVFMMS